MATVSSPSLQAFRPFPCPSREPLPMPAPSGPHQPPLGPTAPPGPAARARRRLVLGEGSSRKSRPSPHSVFRKVPQAPLPGFLFCSSHKLSGEQKQGSLGTELGAGGGGQENCPSEPGSRQGSQKTPRAVTPHQETSGVTRKELNFAPGGPGRPCLLHGHFLFSHVVRGVAGAPRLLAWGQPLP